MSLKELIEAELVRKEAADLAKAEKDRLAAQHAADMELARANAVIAEIESRIIQAIQSGKRSVSLYDVGFAGSKDPSSLTGVGGRVYRYLVEQGCGDRAYVDIDCSGNYQSHDMLCLRLK